MPASRNDREGAPKTHRPDGVKESAPPSGDPIVDAPPDQERANDRQRDQLDRAGVSEQPSSPGGETLSGAFGRYHGEDDRYGDRGDRSKGKTMKATTASAAETCALRISIAAASVSE
jgi:hypothetical protein